MQLRSLFTACLGKYVGRWIQEDEMAQTEGNGESLGIAWLSVRTKMCLLPSARVAVEP